MFKIMFGMKIKYGILLAAVSLVSCKESRISSTPKLMEGVTATDSVVKQEAVGVDDNNPSSSHLKQILAKKDSVSEGQVKMEKDTGKCYIYLTLDDGPQPPGTINCKNILEKNQVKATFFMIGEHYSLDKERRDLADSIEQNPLFLVGNHSETHAFHNRYATFYKHPEKSILDFEVAEQKLNLRYKIARLPGCNTWAFDNQLKGQSEGFSVAKKLSDLDYSVYGWDVEWPFKNGSTPVKSATQMVKEVENALKNNHTRQPKSVVILAHDRMFGKPQYADSLNKFITTLKGDHRYVFETLENYKM